MIYTATVVLTYHNVEVEVEDTFMIPEAVLKAVANKPVWGIDVSHITKVSGDPW